MKKAFREIIGDTRLLCGFIAFAAAGVVGAMGGTSSSWALSLLNLGAACVLAVVAITLLTKPKKTKTVTSDAVDPRYRELIDVLGVSNETFARFYAPMLEQLSEHALTFAIRVIKCRRGVMLGTEKGQESVRRNRDRWTYAVFVVAISGIGRSDKEKAAGMTQVLFSMPQDAREWLKREALVVETLTEALVTPNDKNPITRLVGGTHSGEAKALTSVTPRYPEPEAPESPPEAARRADRDLGMQRQRLQEALDGDEEVDSQRGDSEPTTAKRVSGFGGQFVKSTVS